MAIGGDRIQTQFSSRRPGDLSVEQLKKRTPLKGQCDEMYIFEDLNILTITFCVCADGFQDLSKAFRHLMCLLTFYLLLKNYLLILRMLNETSSEFPSL